MDSPGSRREVEVSVMWLDLMMRGRDPVILVGSAQETGAWSEGRLRTGRDGVPLEVAFK